MKRFVKKHKLLSILIIVFVIVIVVSGIKKFQKARALDAALLAGIEVQDYQEYLENLKSTPSDIDGKSQYEKAQMGLDYKDGSDTDYDGISDKLEIEEYGTDPLKASTAGDLYSDGYKVENGMDPLVNYEYEGDVSFSYNECQEVKLEADEPTDLYAVVQDYTSRYSLSDYGIDKIYKGYWLYNYNGNVSLDLTSIFETENIDSSDINVWVYKGDFLVYGISELEKCKFHTENSMITLNYQFDNQEKYYIYITGKKSMAASFFTKLGNTASMQISESTDNTGVAFMCGSPILEQIFNTSGHVYYSELSDESKGASFLNKAIEYCNSKVLGSKITSEDSKKLTASSTQSVKLTAKIYQTLFPMCEAKPEGEETIFNYLFNYTVYEDAEHTLTGDNSSGTNNDNNDEHYNNYHTAFDPYVDELPFQNFESQYGTTGNCTGISYLTAYLFNTGSFPSTGSYNGVSWDLTTDQDNATLMNPTLYDFKTNSFVDDHSGNYNNYIGENLTEGETEFVKMIGALWMESNDKLPYLDDYMMTDGRTNDWSLAEDMMSYLDQGKILCVGLYLKNGTGHEVNIYDYYYTDAGELLFRVYDSNFPQNSLDGVELNCDGACYLQCKKIIRPDGTSSFSYLYWPVKDNVEYLASSNKNLMGQNSIVVADEKWNVFNN